MIENRQQRLLVILGTRPEAIKLAPVVAAARKGCEVTVLSTGQHRDLLASIVALFDLTIDVNLDLMRPDQSPSDLLAAALEGIDAHLATRAYDWIIVQGDTSTTLAGALAGFHRKIPVAHVEAGLRSGAADDPFPEEMNRRLVSQIATLHLAATETNRQNLLAEGIDAASIVVTGNPVVDALDFVVRRDREPSESLARLLAEYGEEKLLLLTTHRRENIGERRRSIFDGVNRLLRERSDCVVIYPVHPNPQVRAEVTEGLDEHERLHLIDPLDYADFVRLMQHCYLAMTDSGGVQEEGPALGLPVLVLRETTERPEAIEAGSARLIGADGTRLVNEVTRLLDDPAAYKQMASTRSVYGETGAGKRIVEAIRRTPQTPPQPQ